MEDDHARRDTYQVRIDYYQGITQKEFPSVQCVVTWKPAVAIISIVSTPLQLITSRIPWQTEGMKCSLYRLSKGSTWHFLLCMLPQSIGGERSRDVTLVEFLGSHFRHDDSAHLRHCLPNTPFIRQLSVESNFRISITVIWKINDYDHKLFKALQGALQALRLNVTGKHPLKFCEEEFLSFLRPFVP